jgi:hypothetical protein
LFSCAGKHRRIASAALHRVYNAMERLPGPADDFYRALGPTHASGYRAGAVRFKAELRRFSDGSGIGLTIDELDSVTRVLQVDDGSIPMRQFLDRAFLARIEEVRKLLRTATAISGVRDWESLFGTFADRRRGSTESGGGEYSTLNSLQRASRTLGLTVCDRAVCRTPQVT